MSTFVKSFEDRVKDAIVFLIKDKDFLNWLKKVLEKGKVK